MLATDLKLGETIVLDIEGVYLVTLRLDQLQWGLARLGVKAPKEVRIFKIPRDQSHKALKRKAKAAQPRRDA